VLHYLDNAGVVATPSRFDFLLKSNVRRLPLSTFQKLQRVEIIVAFSLNKVNVTLAASAKSLECLPTDRDALCHFS
jgi:hypothetical protein